MEHLTVFNGYNYCMTPYGVAQGNINQTVTAENVDLIPCELCRHRARMVIMGCDHFITDNNEVIPYESVNRTETNGGIFNIVFDDGDRMSLSDKEYFKFRTGFVDWRTNG